MTRTQFRWILGGYLVTVVISIVVSDLTKPLIPAVRSCAAECGIAGVRRFVLLLVSRPPDIPGCRVA
jgi:hypothetical protein